MKNSSVMGTGLWCLMLKGFSWRMLPWENCPSVLLSLCSVSPEAAANWECCWAEGFTCRSFLVSLLWGAACIVQGENKQTNHHHQTHHETKQKNQNQPLRFSLGQSSSLGIRPLTFVESVWTNSMALRTTGQSLFAALTCYTSFRLICCDMFFKFMSTVISSLVWLFAGLLAHVLLCWLSALWFLQTVLAIKRSINITIA